MDIKFNWGEDSFNSHRNPPYTAWFLSIGRMITANTIFKDSIRGSKYESHAKEFDTLEEAKRFVEDTVMKELESE